MALCLGPPRRFWTDFEGTEAFSGAVCRARGGNATLAWRNKAVIVGAAILEARLLQPIEIA